MLYFFVKKFCKKFQESLDKSQKICGEAPCLKEVSQMNLFANQLKNCIFDIISEMEKHRDTFLFSDPHAFSRKRKWDFATLIRFLLSFGSNSLGLEIGEFFNYKEGFPTVSSFVQQRKKLHFSALEFLFHQFNDRVSTRLRLFKNYRLLAIDGSDLAIPYNPGENNCKKDKQSSAMHLNGLFDVINKIFVDVIIETETQKDETGMGCKMIDRIRDTYPVIVIADRNYENYNFFAHVEENLYDYVVRIKDRDSTGILSGMKLPDQEEFDITRQMFITRQHSLLTKLMAEKYKYISRKKRFDFSEAEKESRYEMTIRFVRFRLAEDTYECLATSLPEELFSTEDLKEIYRRRWGIETSFRELKYVLGIAAFHAKQENSILQEVFARVIMYNFSMLIANRAEAKEKDLKYKLQVNYTQAIRISQHFFRHLDSGVLYDIEKTIQRFLLPVRPNRKNQRTTPGKDAVPFNYRLA